MPTSARALERNGARLGWVADIASRARLSTVQKLPSENDPERVTAMEGRRERVRELIIVREETRFSPELRNELLIPGEDVKQLMRKTERAPPRGLGCVKQHRGRAVRVDVTGRGAVVLEVGAPGLNAVPLAGRLDQGVSRAGAEVLVFMKRRRQCGAAGRDAAGGGAPAGCRLEDPERGLGRCQKVDSLLTQAQAADRSVTGLGCPILRRIGHQAWNV